jgi:hypothetical protein
VRAGLHPGVPDHPLTLIAGFFIGCAAAIAVAIATRVRLLPEVVDISLVPTGAGVGSLVAAAIGAALRWPRERIGRLTLLGTLLGGGVTALLIGAALIADVVS